VKWGKGERLKGKGTRSPSILYPLPLTLFPNATNSKHVLVQDVSLFSSQDRQSSRQIKNIMEAVLGIEMSLGSINRLRTEVSEAIHSAVTAAIGYVQQQPIVGVDETGFKQRNILDFLAESVSAARSGQIPPSLLP